jgi:hypothetical protein
MAYVSSDQSLCWHLHSCSHLQWGCVPYVCAVLPHPVTSTPDHSGNLFVLPAVVIKYVKTGAWQWVLDIWGLNEWVNTWSEWAAPFLNYRALGVSLIVYAEVNFLQHFCWKEKNCYNFSFLLFSNLLSRPIHGQHRHDGIQTKHYKTGHHSPRGKALDSIDPMPRVLSPPSSQISPCSSTVSLPSHLMCQTYSLSSVPDPNDANFSDTMSDSMNDQEENLSSVWKLSDLTDLLVYVVWFYFLF